VMLSAKPLAAQSTLQITTTTLPDALQGTAYAAQLTATGGTAPYTWSMVGGSLPTGVTIASSGGISGTPSDTTGTFAFTVRVTDSAVSPQTANQVLTIRVAAPLVITTTSLPNAIVGTAYPAQTLTAAGGLTPLSWAITAGSLPSGLVSSASGSIFGTPSSSGIFTFIVRVTDSSSTPRSATQALSITVTATLAITTSSLPSGVVDTAYTAQTLTAAGGTAPFTWVISTGQPPPGLVLSTDGIFAGTPTTAGTFVFT